MTEISDILSPIEAEIKEISESIPQHLKSNLSVINDLGKYMLEEGKRVRSALVLLSSLACAYSGRNHIKLSIAIEFIHTATLLHDDVIDHATERRGKSSAPQVWGNNISVLAGDFLYSRAFEILCEVGNYQLLEVISRTTNIIAEGEVQQMINIGRNDLSEDEYMQVIERKTAKLFEAACFMGSIIATSDNEMQRKMAHFGLNFGMAFQLMDDLLDYTDNTGKLKGQDLKEGKFTLPLIHALSHCDNRDHLIIKQALQSDKINEVISICNKMGSFGYVREKADNYIHKSINEINDMPDSVYKDALKALLKFVVERNY